RRLPAGHGIAGLDEQLEDPSGIGGKDRRRAVFVDCDLAFGHALGLKHQLLHRLDRQRRPLLSRWIEHTTLGLARKLVALGTDSSVGMFGCRPAQPPASNDEGKRYPPTRKPP